VADERTISFLVGLSFFNTVIDVLMKSGEINRHLQKGS
jgi:hypothetical protein